MEDTVGSAVHGQTSIRDKRTVSGWMHGNALGIKLSGTYSLLLNIKSIST